MSTKYAAFGAHLELGTSQVETAVIVIDGPTFLLTGTGNADVTITHAAMTGSGVAKSVALVTGDNTDTVATKIAAHMTALSDVTDHMTVKANGPNVIMELVDAAADDGTLNMAYANDDALGLTNDASSNDTVAGVVKVETAGVKSIGGPSLSLDTEDVTTHDQANFWEQVVATILRSGEISMDIVYDPADATHDAATGLVYRLEDKIRTFFDLVFPNAENWTFYGKITGFEPTAEVASYLAATIKVKITGQPTLE